MDSWQDFKKEIKVSEGNISHMYLDTVGKVTIGVGNMLPNVAAAQALPLRVRSTMKTATAAEVKTDFETVSKQAKGKIASNYKIHTKLDMEQKDIDALLDKRISGFKKELKQKFPDFDSYPIKAQFALTDLAFNLGTNGLVTKFPKLTKAVKDKDWLGAAAQSNRPQVNAHRNKTVMDWFKAAHTASMVNLNLPRVNMRQP